MSSLWLTKDIARLILAHTDLATTWALALTCKLLCKEIRGGALLLKRAEGRLLDFQPKRQEELSVKTVRELMEMDRKVWKTRLRLVLFGDGGVGKTASSIMFTNNFFVEEYDPTVEDSYRKQITIGKSSLMFELMDTAGCMGDAPERFLQQQGWYDFNSGDHGIVVVYSITSRSSLERAEEILALAAAHLGEDARKNMILVGNKLDLADQHREVDAMEGITLARKYEVAFIESSAKEFDAVSSWMLFLMMKYCARTECNDTEKKKCNVM